MLKGHKGDSNLKIVERALYKEPKCLTELKSLPSQCERSIGRGRGSRAVKILHPALLLFFIRVLFLLVLLLIFVGFT